MFLPAEANNRVGKPVIQVVEGTFQNISKGLDTEKINAIGSGFPDHYTHC